MAVRAQTFRPAGAARCKAAIDCAMMQMPLSLEDDPKSAGYALVDPYGDAIGYISARHWIAQELADGRRLLHLTVNGLSGSPVEPPTGVTVRAAIGDEGDFFEMPPMLKKPPRGVRLWSEEMLP